MIVILMTERTLILVHKRIQAENGLTEECLSSKCISVFTARRALPFPLNQDF